jgi:hypothetical protein
MNQLSTADSEEFQNKNRQKEDWGNRSSMNGCRIAVRRRKGVSLRSRAAHALAPPDRDTARGRGLPETQGG